MPPKLPVAVVVTVSSAVSCAAPSGLLRVIVAPPSGRASGSGLELLAVRLKVNVSSSCHARPASTFFTAKPTSASDGWAAYVFSTEATVVPATSDAWMAPSQLAYVGVNPAKEEEEEEEEDSTIVYCAPSGRPPTTT